MHVIKRSIFSFCVIFSFVLNGQKPNNEELLFSLNQEPFLLEVIERLMSEDDFSSRLIFKKDSLKKNYNRVLSEIKYESSIEDGHEKSCNIDIYSLQKTFQLPPCDDENIIFIDKIDSTKMWIDSFQYVKFSTIYLKKYPENILKRRKKYNLRTPDAWIRWYVLMFVSNGKGLYYREKMIYLNEHDVTKIDSIADYGFLGHLDFKEIEWLD